MQISKEEKEIKISKLYSFDVFDTLITRTTAHPTGIFSLMQDEIQKNEAFKNISLFIKNSFYDIRIEAERFVRENAKKYNNRNDITFEEIYNFIAINYRLLPLDIQKLMNLEIQTELANFIPVNENIEKLKMLIEEGNRVVLISDMYHSSETIRKFLLKFDEVFKDIKIYVSSEYKEGKYNKKLFELIGKIENVKFTDWHHLGDNIRADYQIPKELGIKARNLPFEKLLKYEKDLLWRYRFSSDVQIIAGGSRNSRFFNRCACNPAYELGSSYFTPVLYSYVMHTLNDALKNKIEELVFISRDGYILKQIADIIIEYKNLPIKTKYFYGSRKAFRVPTEYNYIHFIEIIFNEFLSKLCVSFLAERLNAAEGELAKYLQIENCGRIFTIKERQEIKNKFLTNESLKEYVISANMERARLLKKYLEQELDFNKKFAFVELSGTGATQDILQSIIKTITNYDITTYYLRIENNADLDKSNKKFYIAVSGGFNYIVELFCRNFEGQTLCYKEENNKIVPVLEEFDASNLKNWGWESYLKAVLDYTKYMVKNENFDITDVNFASIFQYVKNYFLYNSDKNLADLIGSIPFKPIGSETDRSEYSRKYTIDDVFKDNYVECPLISRKRTGKKILELLDAKNKYKSTRKAFFNICASFKEKEIEITILGKTFNYLKKSSKKTAKKILLVSHELTYTGAPHSLLNIAQVLLKNNKYVEVYSLKDGEFKKEFEKLGIKVTIKPYDRYNDFVFFTKLLKFDLAILNTILAAPAYKFLKDFLPCIWYIREATNIPQFFGFVPFAKELISTSKDIYAVSEYAKDFIEDKFNVPVKVVHNSSEDFNNNVKKVFSKDKIRVLVMGTLEYRKRFDLAAEAVKTMPDEYQNKIELKIAGQIIKSAFTQPFLKSIENIQNINYIGEIKSLDKKIELYKTTDIVVVPSMDESCSRIVLESAMMGIPVIVSRNVGAKYMVNPDTGWIVRTGEYEPIRQILMDIVDGRYDLDKMSTAIRNKYLETSTIDIYEKNIINMINENAYKPVRRRLKLYLKSVVRELFSVRNSIDKKHKIITVTGIKIKIKKEQRT